MKKYDFVSVLLLFWLLYPVISPAQQTTLVMIHPTESNVKSVAYLLEEEMIDIPDIEIIGAYYAYENYDYSQTRDLIKDEGLTQFSLQVLADSIPENAIFRENSLTEGFRALFEQSDGMLFFGGPDMPPSIYGEKTHLLTSIYDPQRHFFEVSFLAHLLGTTRNPDMKAFLNENPEYVVYGFCLGMQTMNVAAGGTLIQDIPLEVYGISFKEDVLDLSPDNRHRNYQKRITYYDHLLSGNFHRVTIQSEAIAGKSYVNATPKVLSNHHQAVEKQGKSLKTAALSEDEKITEALVHSQFPHVLGVQFHPEPGYIYQQTQRFKYRLQDAFTSGPEILQETESMEFHRAFWKHFARKLQKAAAQ